MLTLASIDTQTAQLLGSLCAYFDDEIERQENVLRLCHAQGEAARAMDAATLEQQSEALALVLTDCALAEPMRIDLVGGLTERLSPTSREWTLTELIALVPTPWNDRLKQCQSRLSAVASETRGVVAANAAMIRHSLRIVGDSVDRVLGPETASGYTDCGDLPASGRRAPALLNARG